MDKVSDVFTDTHLRRNYKSMESCPPQNLARFDGICYTSNLVLQFVCGKGSYKNWF